MRVVGVFTLWTFGASKRSLRRTSTDIQMRGSKIKHRGSPISNGKVRGQAAQKPDPEQLDRKVRNSTLRNLFQEGSNGRWCLTLLRVS